MAKIAIQGNPAGTGTITFQPPNTNTNRTVSLPDVDGTMAVAEQASVPIGSLLWVTGTSAPAGYVAANGQLLDRATYPALWAYANSSGNIVADGSWTKGKYSTGNGTTSFRVPDLRDRYIRGASGTRPVGLVEEDAFQGHWHEMYDSNATGSFTRVGGSSGNVIASTFTAKPVREPIADGTNGTPRIADETRVKGVILLPCIRAYDILTNPELLNAASVVSQVNSLEVAKLNKSDNIVLGASVTASGTAVDFVGIPAGVKRVTVMFDGVSTNGASIPLIRLGDGVIQDSGYMAAGGYIVAGNGASALQSNVGFLFNQANAAASTYAGVTILSKAGQSWFASGMSARVDVNPSIQFTAGLKTLSGTLDRIRITTVNGTDQFDAGTINISWEF